MDAALAENASLFGRPSLRVYQWQPHCISLGYHQKTRTLDLEICANRGIDVVRRPTGGRAVLHAEELTYAVVLPPSEAEAGSVESVYRLISRGLVVALNKLGVTAEFERRPLDLHTHYQSALSESCFSAAAKYEIVIRGRKLVGSAQRRFQTGVLQHGSILTGDAHLDLPDYFRNLNEKQTQQMKEEIATKTASIRSATGRTIEFEAGATAIRDGIGEALGVTFEEEGLTGEEVELARAKEALYKIL